MSDTLQESGFEMAGDNPTRPPSVVDAKESRRRIAKSNTPKVTLPALLNRDGIALLDELVAVFSRHVILSRGAAEALALWTIHSHAHDAAHISPILAITSPEMRCGKTTLLEILQALTPNAILTANVTAPAIFRLVDKFAPTLLIDEADSFLAGQEQMRGILNSGHRRSSATIVRIDAGREPRPFRTWGPKVIALIGSLPDTLADRSIIVRLQRKRRDDVVERLRFDGLERLRHLRALVSRWAERHLEELRTAEPEIPSRLHDRAADNWRPLLAIADMAGGSWPAKARSAAVQLSGNKGDAETQSRSRKSARDAKWSFCLTTGTLCPRIRRDHEQKTAPEPHTGLQG
jgi:putative DNA primase/helicase